MAVLHDRRIPGSKANIDHLVISGAGVFVLDSKNYTGRVEQRDLGGFFKTDLRLYVGGRNRTALVAGMAKQVDAVRIALSQHDAWKDVPVIPAILFVSATNWSLFNIRPLRFGNVQVLWWKALLKLVRSGGPVSPAAIAEIERALAVALSTA